MEDVLVGFVQTGKLDFASLIDSMLADLTRLTIRMAVLGPLAQALGSGGGGGLAGWLSGLFGSAPTAGSGEPGAAPGPGTGGLYAEGGVFEHGTVVPFAHGGVVDRPTLFPMARGYGLMGEAGPEAVLPLKRLASGRLGVEAAGRPARPVTGTPVTVVMNITTPDVGGFRASQGQLAAQAARAMARAQRNL